jgi:hypothetical protein
MLDKTWRFLGSVNLTIWLLLALSLNLAIGSQYAKYLGATYNQLNFLRFQEWLAVNGIHESWWVWSLFALLALFGANTAVCTADRLYFLLKKRRDYRFSAFVVTVSPSVMHLCFLVIIGGHAISQFSADIRQLPVVDGAQLSLSPAVVSVQEFRCSYRTEPGLTGLPEQCSVTLSLASPKGTVIREVGILSPLFWEGYSIHLNVLGKIVRGETPKLQLIIKKDPGLPLILIGNVFLCILMLWYFPIIIKNRNGGKHVA